MTAHRKASKVVGPGKIDRFSERLRSVEGWPTSGGRNAYAAYLRGENIGRTAAIVAKCADCCCGYADGRFDCGIKTCSLHPFMPYRKRHPAGTSEIKKEMTDGSEES